MSDDLETLPGVGPATADKLVDAGYDTYEAIAVASPSELANEADIGDSTAGKVVKAAKEEEDLDGFETGADVLDRRQEIGKITTGVGAFDDLLSGGIETQAITEVYGEFSSGKSQVSHQLAVNAQLPPEESGMGGQVYFIDTEDTFRPNRISEMVRGLSDEKKLALLAEKGVEGDVNDEVVMDELVREVLDDINVAKAFNSDHQMLLCEEALDEARELEDNVGLLVIDSLTAHFRAEYVGRGELAERQQKLNKHLADVSSFGSMLNAGVVITNQVASNPDSYFGDPTQPIGGNILGHKSTVRLYIRKSKDNKRIVKLVDSPDLPEGEAVFRITGGGLADE